MAYCTHCADAQKEIKDLKRFLEVRMDDSISHSMIKFINHKNISDEWAHFLLAEIHERIAK